MPSKPFDESTKIVVARVGELSFGMIVDQILENVTLEQTHIDPAPTVKMQISRECVLGIGSIEGRMITILNLEKINEEIKNEVECNK